MLTHSHPSYPAHYVKLVVQTLREEHSPHFLDLVAALLIVQPGRIVTIVRRHRAAGEHIDLASDGVGNLAGNGHLHGCVFD